MRHTGFIFLTAALLVASAFGIVGCRDNSDDPGSKRKYYIKYEADVFYTDNPDQMATADNDEHWHNDQIWFLYTDENGDFHNELHPNGSEIIVGPFSSPQRQGFSAFPISSYATDRYSIRGKISASTDQRRYQVVADTTILGLVSIGSLAYTVTKSDLSTGFRPKDFYVKYEVHVESDEELNNLYAAVTTQTNGTKEFRIGKDWEVVLGPLKQNDYTALWCLVSGADGQADINIKISVGPKYGEFTIVEESQTKGWDGYANYLLTPDYFKDIK